jgi:hypothetical protein
MTVVLVEGWDHMAAGDAPEKGWSGNVSMASGRFGGNAYNGETTSRLKSLPASYATIIMGFAFKYRAVVDTPILVQFRDSGTAHVDLRYTVSTTTFSITRAGTSLGTYIKPLTLNQWYYLEFKATISDTVGVVELKIDGVSVINLSSQDTRNGANATVNEIVLSNGAQFTVGDIDDIYVVDTSGGAPTNDYLGDIRVEALFPNGNGNTSNLTGSDGNSTDNYLLVDEVTPNDDTDYVESSTVGDKDTYAFGNLTPTTGTVYAVQPCLYAKKTDAGTRKIASIARLSGTEVDSADQTLGASYAYFTDIREAKPGGGVWTITDVNNAEFGVKVVA